MKLIKLCLAGEGIAFVNRIGFRVPNSTMTVDLPEKLSFAELKQYDLYYLNEAKVDPAPYQTVRTTSVNIDEENRTVTREYIYEDYPWDDIERDLINERKFTVETMERKGIRNAKMFKDVHGNLKAKAFIPLDADNVIMSIDAVIAIGAYDVNLCFGVDNFISFANEEEAEAFKYKYRENMINFKKDQAVVLGKNALALSSKDVELARQAIIALREHNAKWHGE